jgi:hypothetical protein
MGPINEAFGRRLESTNGPIVAAPDDREMMSVEQLVE